MKWWWIAGGAAATVVLVAWSRRAQAAEARTFEAIFKDECRGIPSEYMHALAKRESNFNPGNTEGAAWGLLQVVETVRIEFNQKYGTAWARDHLLNPTINARIACDLLSRIAAAFLRNHPKAFPPGTGWNNKRFVELVTFGWNAGYSESRGVGRVIGEMERRGITGDSVNIDSVYETALGMEDVSKWVKQSSKVSWCKSVVVQYIKNLRATRGSV